MHALDAEAFPELDRIYVVEDDAPVIAGLFHVGLCAAKGPCDDAIGPVIGNNVEHRNVVACRGPEGGVRVVEGTIADETDDRFVGSTEFRADRGTHTEAFRASSGSDIFVVTGIAGVFKNVLGNGVLLDGYQAAAEPFEGPVKGVGQDVRTHFVWLLDDRPGGVPLPGAQGGSFFSGPGATVVEFVRRRFG